MISTDNPVAVESFKAYPTKISHDTQYEGDLSDVTEEDLNPRSDRVIGEDPHDALDNDNLEDMQSSKDIVQHNTKKLSGTKINGAHQVRQNITNNIKSFPSVYDYLVKDSCAF